MTAKTLESMQAVRKEAETLAKANRDADPEIEAVYFFPDDAEIRLVEVARDALPTDSDTVEPFYFAPSPADGLHFTSAIALIRREDVHALRLPPGWGTWGDAQKL